MNLLLAQSTSLDEAMSEGLERPEQAELVQSLKATISSETKAERQGQMLVNQARKPISASRA